MDNSIHNDEQIVQRQVIKKYNGARPWQVAVNLDTGVIENKTTGETFTAAPFRS